MKKSDNENIKEAISNLSVSTLYLNGITECRAREQLSKLKEAIVRITKENEELKKDVDLLYKYLVNIVMGKCSFCEHGRTDEDPCDDYKCPTREEIMDSIRQEMNRS